MGTFVHTSPRGRWIVPFEVEIECRCVTGCIWLFSGSLVGCPACERIPSLLSYSFARSQIATRPVD